MDYPVEVVDSSPSKPRPRRRSTSTSSCTRSSSSSSSSQNFSRPSINRKPVPGTQHSIPQSTSLPLRSHSAASRTQPAPLPLRSHSDSSRIQTTSIAARPHRAARTPKNPVYFLTGANRSIGLEFVRQLSTQPTTTIIASVRSLTSDTSALQTLARTSPATIHIIECDVCSADSLSSIEFRVAEILSKHSANLTHIFNIAATSPTPTDTSLTLDPAILAAHMATNVLGPAKVVQVLRRYLARGATVLNVSSGLASLSNAAEAPRACSFAVANAALNMLTVHQARDLRSAGVRVVCVDPGWVKTRVGGKGATVEVSVSVEGMLEVVGGLRERDSGRFFRYDGAVVPW